MTNFTTLYKSVEKILWGYIFILFHLKINSFDLLPDFVGCILIALGIYQAAAELKHYSFLFPFSIFNAAYSIVSLAVSFIAAESNVILHSLSIISSVVTIAFNFILLTDLSLIAVRYQSPDQAIDKKIITARNIFTGVYATLAASAMAGILTLLTDNDVFAYVSMGIGFISLFMFIVVLIILLLALSKLMKLIKSLAEQKSISFTPFTAEETDENQ